MDEQEKIRREFDWKNSTPETRDEFYKNQKVACIGNPDNEADRQGWFHKIWNQYNMDGSTLLDLCCHDGYVGMWALSRDATLIGIDISEDAIKTAREVASMRYPESRWSFECTNIRDIKWNVLRPDVTIFFEALEHFERQEGLDIIKIIDNVTKNCVMISTPRADGQYNADDNESHINMYMPDELGEDVERITGIKPIIESDDDFIYCHWFPEGSKYA